ncbi:hypothetical protein JL475_32215 [Streptomyces sp. M2CJ-2]|uniref:hypothetical protein n=1 Tax=Streptomyces sp. M2CJ-2 TaxID=2803948 RepID=UPI0019263A88|nr:hypothetical protein [Streptomyces sp. M2CJ-2]MBL3670559.1 hypothetical protein [Streptomyces sp. M2CJ-2]
MHDAFDAGNRGIQRQWVRDGLVEAARAVIERHPDLTVTTDVVEDGAVPALLVAAAESGTPVLGSRGQGALVRAPWTGAASRVLEGTLQESQSV